MCFVEPRPQSFASARTDEEYVLALDAATRRGEVLWRSLEGAAWLGEIHGVACTEHAVSVRRGGAGCGVLQTVDRRGRRLRTIVAGKKDAPLLLALTRLLVAVYAIVEGAT